MILVFTPEINPRITYTMHFLLGQIIGVDYELTTDKKMFSVSQQARLNYSYTDLGEGVFIKAHELLFSRGLADPVIQKTIYNGETCLFATTAGSALPFDPLAASFYLVSRFEEYGHAKRDRYNRYESQQSILVREGLIKKPVAEIWAGMLAEVLKLRYPQLKFKKRKAQFIPTVDIDNAWAYRHKGFLRSAGALGKAALKLQWNELISRILVIAGMKKDPYDTYRYLFQKLDQVRAKSCFFFLLGDYAPYDKNIHPGNKYLRKLIREVASKYHTGIHPSYRSGEDPDRGQLQKEIGRLGAITGEPVAKSRQHYLRLELPVTYRRLSEAGITEDYSMGYPDRVGFRAGTCTPFHFYDLEKEASSHILIYPFQVMDVTLQQYLNYTPDEAIREIEELMDETSRVGGVFTGIWHNESLSEEGPWKGYREVFEVMLKRGAEFL